MAIENVEDIGKNFASAYYNAMSGGKANAVDLYCDTARMSFEGNYFCGKPQILEKLMGLPQKLVYVPSTIDSHQIKETTLAIAVMGQLKADDDKPLSFSQIFILEFVAESWYITNDIFRMILHNG